jgi:coenzyme F420-reducing hydrogenase alpha subunit
VRTLLARIEAALPEARELVRWTARWPFPRDEQDFTCVALRHPDEYPMNAGRIVSSSGLDIDAGEYETRFRELHVPHSTALHAQLDGAPYLVGPLARINLGAERLHREVRETLVSTGVHFPSRNMFHSVVARAVEIQHALLEAARLLRAYEVPPAPFVAVTPRAGEGAWATEAPRGLLWHRYGLDGEGRIAAARIVPPTSQNQARIEADLRTSIERMDAGTSDADLRRRAETIIRNYDPCISCATHFLDLTIERV